MQRLLCLISCMNTGGAETFLMKIYRTIDRSKYQLDFCVNIKEKNFYEDEINALGGHIYRIPSKSENLKEFKRQLSDLIKKENYQYVLRITSNAMGFLDLKIAKKAGAGVCCARSSNSSDGESFKTKIAHLIGHFMYKKYVDVAIAPSDLAAMYTFGKRAFENKKVYLLHNAVDLDIFRYDENLRNRIRQEFDISLDTKILGHIGRFMEQKNHLFLLDVFKSIKEREPNSVLLLVGEGTLREVIKKRLNELGLSDSVIFTGVRADIPALLSAMDVFVFPSLYEGMPNTVIEAQATGLPCVISDAITKEAKITGLVEYLPITATPEVWSQKIIKKLNRKRVDTKQDFIDNKYDIASTSDEFIRIIFNH